ncbi:MAG: RNA-binding S4 domain-containing protein [Nitrospirae bacterium]|nr:RNA-binding S4 domain-containing protein [Nitrospirota bacterium]
MRLDMFLKVSRLIKRRTVAKDSCDGGKIKVGGSSAKAAREVKPGDMIDLKIGKRRVVVEVLEIPKGNVAKELAANLYRVVEETKIEEDLY